MNRCRLCGHEGEDVRTGLYRTKAGKFVAILKCEDRKACQLRQPRKSDAA